MRQKLPPNFLHFSAGAHTAFSQTQLGHLLTYIVSAIPLKNEILYIMYIISLRETAAVFDALCRKSLPLTVFASRVSVTQLVLPFSKWMNALQLACLLALALATFMCYLLFLYLSNNG